MKNYLWCTARVYSWNFTLYVNELFNISKTLNPIMLEDNANLFVDKNVTALFQKANSEQKKLSKQFKENKLLLDIDKAKYTIFCKP